MANVIIIEPTSLVLHETRDFGSLIYVYDKKFQVFDVELIVQKTICKLDEIKYNPMEDSICLTGAAQTVAIFMSAVAGGYPEFMILIFDNRTNRYKQRIFKL